MIKKSEITNQKPKPIKKKTNMGGNKCKIYDRKG